MHTGMEGVGLAACSKIPDETMRFDGFLFGQAVIN